MTNRPIDAVQEQQEPSGLDACMDPMDEQLLQANVHALQAEQYEREDDDREIGG